jgi:predicted nuclease with RNAse H fold
LTVRTLGIDLSAQPKQTAACWIAWKDGVGRVEAIVEQELSDSTLVDLCLSADRAAIDAPFGWPEAFVDAIAHWRDESGWPGPDREVLRFRETDRFVRRGGQNALSVSSDKIAVTAMRCASILSSLARRLGGEAVDRIDDRVIEAYPAAALRAWGFDPTRYKGPKPENVTRRTALVATIARAAWLEFSEDERRGCVASDISSTPLCVH